MVDAPFFVTVLVAEGGRRHYGPGNFDPIVNTELQEALLKKAAKAWLKVTKDKIAIVLDALQQVHQHMKVYNKIAWWDNTHFVIDIPPNVGNLCRKNYGRPRATDCERAAFNFIKTGPTPQITSEKPIVFQSG